VAVFVGERLRSRRMAAGKSREQLAVDVGRSLYSIAGYELGHIDPPASIVAALADSLGCSPGDLFEIAA
jgi:transcriptional regulator with XRE-family HTH domain